MPNAEFWFNVMDKKAGRFTVQEDWEKDTSKYIDTLKAKATNKQTKTYLDGLKKHLKDNGFLSDEQKSSLANLTHGSKGDEKGTSSGTKDTSSGTKEKPKSEKPKSDTSNGEKDEPKKKITKESGKEIKKQIGALLGKFGGLGKDTLSKVDSQAANAIETGVAGGANVKDATASVLDKIKDDLLKKKEAKDLEKKKKKEAKKQKKAKKEGFEYRFKDYLK
jgi:hypothetical protein